MREALKKLVNETIILEYKLPCSTNNISKSKYTSENDDCYFVTNNEDIVPIIYNSIIEYSFKELNISDQDFSKLISKALLTKLRYDEKHTDDFKLKYGFYGEVLLYSFLSVFYKSNAFISRGYFYQPLEKSETKGYDAYHLIEDRDNIELWFGEVKFRADYKSGISSALGNIQKAISDDYLNSNLLAISGQLDSANATDSKLYKIIDSWDSSTIKLIEEIKKYNIKLIYPILIIFDDKKQGYNELINDVIDNINANDASNVFKISIDYSIFFILVPVSNAVNIKREVLEWIKLKKPLI